MNKIKFLYLILLSFIVVACGGGSSDTTVATTYSIGGTLNGLGVGNTITVSNGTNNITLTADGAFVFPTKLADDSSYSLSIVTLPTNQPCTYTYGAGLVTGADVTNIDLFCGPVPAYTWSAGGNLVTARFSHTATLLPNGNVLVVAGGSGIVGVGDINSAELNDRATDTWSATGSLVTARDSHTATLLPNGKVLVAGGAKGLTIFASAELYNPSTNTWSSAGSMTHARVGHTATLLPNGKVLVAGGGIAGGVKLTSAELYNPSTNTWSSAGSLATARDSHTATLLPNGKVLVAGGQNSAGALSSTELYDPTTNTWSAAGSLSTARFYHTATLLPNGKVLVAVGLNTSPSTPTVFLNSAELFDPVSKTWAATGSLTTARYFPTATLLPNGKVLVAGGTDSSGSGYSLASVEIYNPATNTWTAAASLATARAGHTATLLLSGELLVVGGNTWAIPNVVLGSTEVYW